MKCGVCSYEQRWDWIDGEYQKLYPGEAEFIHIEGHFTTSNNNEAYWAMRKVKLFACPNCKTVILESDY